MHIVIIGNGISGVTAARFIRKLSNHEITIISSESKYFYSRTALMYIYMGHMRQVDTEPYEGWFWEKNRINLVFDHVSHVETKDKTLQLKKGESVKYDKLIIATGSKPNKFGWPGQDLDGVGGLYTLQDLERVEEYSQGLKRAVIVGGGLIGIELAEMFHARHIPVTLLVRESQYWENALPLEEATMVGRHIVEHGFDLRLKSELKEILADENGKVRAVVTKSGEEIACGFVGLTAGVSPNVDFLKPSGIEINRGVLVNEFLETNVEDIFAIGDCAERRTALPNRRPIEAVWYTGKMMGETVAYTICKKRTAYEPRLWFNSAKFLDIEYQIYGDVRPASRTPKNHSQLYWEHTNGKKSIRLVYEAESKKILGFNVMGIRYRHEVCEKWLNAGAHIEEVLSNLSLANFDPEFYRTYEADILGVYNQQENANLAGTGSKRPTDALTFIGVNEQRFDSRQERQADKWYATQNGKMTFLAILAIFLTCFLAYYFMKTMGLIYAIPVIAAEVYFLVKLINQHRSVASELLET